LQTKPFVHQWKIENIDKEADERRKIEENKPTIRWMGRSRQ
jgi:hypothetical protein